MVGHVSDHVTIGMGISAGPIQSKRRYRKKPMV